MPKKKTLADRGIVRVTFELPAKVHGNVIHLVGDFTGWEGTPMEKQPDGSWRTTVDLAPDGTYEFRYLIDGTRWENDWDADRYVSNAFGQENSVITTPAIADLTAAQTAPKQSIAQQAGAETSAPKKATATTSPKKTTARKAAGKKASAKKAPAKKTTAVTSAGKKASAKKAPAKKTAAKKTTAATSSPKKPASSEKAGPGSRAGRGSTGGSAPGEPLPMAASRKRGTTEAERDA